MAKRSLELSQEKFYCSICMDLLREPATIPCGHSYCMSCIRRHWDEEQEAQQGVSRCPQCRRTFRPRPVLVKNSILADLVEELRKTGLQAASHREATIGPGDIACDVCTGRLLKACKSCLHCLSSYCELHLQPHHDSPTLRGHRLVEATADLQENVWSHQYKVQQRIQLRERDMEVLQREVEAINESADEAVRHSQGTFTQVLRLLKQINRQSEQVIRTQQQAEVSRARELQERLQEELQDLRMRDAELEELTQSDDHSSLPLSALSPPVDSPSTSDRKPKYFEEVKVVMNDLQNKLKDTIWQELSRISMSELDALLMPAEPKTRAEFLQYSRQITLDPNTVNKRLQLSDSDRTVSFVGSFQPYHDHPERFTDRPQVLSREGLTSRCYFEVKLTGSVSISVSYRSISRSGRESGFGHNNKSWSLYYHINQFIHNRISTPLCLPWSGRVGVYLDYRTGVLAFYKADTMTLLHRVQTSFTQPLHVGFFVGLGSTAELV